MQEKTAPVFVAATANRMDLLPAELLRKGRFDEIFFVDLPNKNERTEIFKVHLNRVRPGLKFNFEMMGKTTSGFSGAEIEQIIIDAMFMAFGNGTELSIKEINEAIAQTTPLSKIAAAQINQIRDSALKNNARPTSNQSMNQSTVNSKQVLEVD